MYSYDDQNYNMLQKTILIEMLIFVFRDIDGLIQ